MKHFHLRIILTVILAAGFVFAFSWIVAWQNYRSLSREASEKESLTREGIDKTLDNLSESWTVYTEKLKNQHEVEAVFASIALQSVIEEGGELEENQKNGMVIRIQDGELSASDTAAGTLGLDASLFRGDKGSFAAPNQPSTFVAYSRIGDTSDYYVIWYEDTVLDDLVRETVDIRGILKWAEITYNVPAIFVSCDQDSGEISGIYYKNSRYFSNCKSLEDLGLTQEDLEKNNAEASGTLLVNDVPFSYISGKSSSPAGYVILLEPVQDLYAKAFVQEGYMIAALIILVTSLLVAGFSLYSYAFNNVLTPEEESAYQPSHVRSIASMCGVLGLVVIVLCGLFSYALNGIYDDAVRGRERLGVMEDSFSLYTERYSQNKQSVHDIYLDYGNLIAEFLDTYPQLRNTAVLSTLADSIHASSITLYDSDGVETVSSGRWNGLELGTDPDSTTYDFRKILRGVPNIIHDSEIDEVTGLNEMRLGIQIRDDSSDDRYGVMMICVDPSALASDVDSENSVRQILYNLCSPGATLWISDSKTGQVLVSSKEELEGEDIKNLGLKKSDLKDALMRTLKTDEGDFLVTSAIMETPRLLEWTEASKSVIAYYKEPKTPVLSGMLLLALTGGVLFLVIYSILACLTLSGYTDDFFNTYKHIKGADDPKNAMGRFRRMIAAASPIRKGITTMEILTAFVLLQMILLVKSDSSAARSTVYNYISTGDWERGFNLFAIAAIVVLAAKTALLVISIRVLLAVCASFSGSKGRTICRLFANVVLYVALIFFLIKAFEYLGFSPTAIAAGMGSLALAISLGSQNFVADIFAGLTYVFEGTVHVGDYVEIVSLGSPGLKGKVVEVGVRCIKLLTREGDFITCSNRDIKTIKNRTQLNTLIICELEVSSAISADDIEQMLKEELPRVGRTDRLILNGPTYNGIISISGGKVKLSVSAECKEEDYYYVRDRLYASLQRIFMEHGYSI